MKKIDHIVYCVTDLQEGIENIEKRFGVRPQYGGKHHQFGTHNALLNIGHGCYFEILAIDPSNQSFTGAHWMGIDLIEEPMITRWAVKSNELQKDAQVLETFNPLLGETKTGKRERQDGSVLQWELSIPLSEPKVEIVPFLLDWQDSVHPTETMPQHCQLKALELYHPEPEQYQTLFEKLQININVQKSDTGRIITIIETPNGTIEI